MPKNDNVRIRKPNRLKNYDYSENGAYFITFCVHNHDNLLGYIRNDTQATEGGRPYIKLTPLGKCVDETIKNANNDKITINKYVVMPNHVHLIVEINTQINTSVQYIVRNIKSYVTKFAGFAVWQKSFHDHIIRNKNDYDRIIEYVENNPKTWIEDRYYNPANAPS